MKCTALVKDPLESVAQGAASIFYGAIRPLGRSCCHMHGRTKSGMRFLHSLAICLLSKISFYANSMISISGNIIMSVLPTVHNSII